MARKQNVLRTMKSRLLLLFSILLFFTVFIVVAFFWYLSRQNNIDAITVRLEKINFDIVNMRLLEKDFFLYTASDTAFYKNNHAPVLTAHASLLEQIQNNLAEVQTSKELRDTNIPDKITEISDKITDFDQLFRRLVTLTSQRGFKDYGAIGQMREAVHQIENSPRLQQLETLLTIRRHEKDYLLRKDPSYVVKLQTTIDTFRVLIHNGGYAISTRQQLLQWITDYEDSFNTIAATDQLIGLQKDEGLKADLQRFSQEIEWQLTEIDKAVNQQAGTISHRIQITYIVIILLGVIISIMVVVLVTRQFANPLAQLSASIDAIIRSNFSQNQQLPFFKSKDEIGMLAANFRRMLQQLHQYTSKIIQQTEAIHESYTNVKLLSEIGQEITANLAIDGILSATSENLSRLMPTSLFAIGLYNDELNSLDFWLINNETGTTRNVDLDSDVVHRHNQLSIYCFSNNQSLLVRNYAEEHEKYIARQTSEVLQDVMQSRIYVPLMVKEKKTGIISVQTKNTGIYTEYHLNILHNLAVYIAIALENADAYRQIGHQKEQILEQSEELRKMNEELFEQKEQLQTTLDHLKHTQSKLVQSEKMASLGQLTAGIAHEINNPINFVYAGIDSLNENFAGIEEVVQQYNSIDATNCITRLPAIAELKEDIEFDEIMQEIPELIISIKKGAERTKEIVKELRTFSRLDEDTLKIIDLHENIESTLVILRNKYKNRVRIERDYRESPLSIECYPGKLNQVFMNLLDNAIQAISGKGTITITTERIQHNTVKITVCDTGSGIPEPVKERIFEPFFTTKAIGEGTGLGLSIVHGIIENHNGKIEVESTEGKGSCFTLFLPIKQAT